MNSNLDPGYIDMLTIDKQLEYIVVRELLAHKEMYDVTIPELLIMLNNEACEQRFSGKTGHSSFRSELEHVFQTLRRKNIFTVSKRLILLSESPRIWAKRYNFFRKDLSYYYQNELIRDLGWQLNLEADSMNLDGTVNGTYTPSDKLILTKDEIEELAKEIWKISREKGEA